MSTRHRTRTGPYSDENRGLILYRAISRANRIHMGRRSASGVRGGGAGARGARSRRDAGSTLGTQSEIGATSGIWGEVEPPTHPDSSLSLGMTKRAVALGDKKGATKKTGPDRGFTLALYGVVVRASCPQYFAVRRKLPAGRRHHNSRIQPPAPGSLSSDRRSPGGRGTNAPLRRLAARRGGTYLSCTEAP